MNFLKKIKNYSYDFQKKWLIKLFISLLYFYALANLGYSIKNTLGYFPEILYTLFPFMNSIFDISLLRILATPEKMYVFYMALLEICVNKSLIRVPILIKFNILLIFLLEMFQNLLICYWDLFFNKEVLTPTEGYYIINKSIAIFVCSLLFIFFFCLYFIAYVQSMLNRIPAYPGFLGEFTKSVALWLRIKKLG